MNRNEIKVPHLIRRCIASTRVFISYSSRDSSFAECLAGDIQNAGLDVWISKWKLNVGDSIVQKISEALRDSDYFIVILSPDSVQSNWVKVELDSALMRQLSGQNISVLPVLYRRCHIPPLLQSRLYANIPKDGYERVLEQLLAVLRQESVGVPEPDTYPAEPCRLWEMSHAELRRCMNRRLMAHEVKTLYFDLLREEVQISDEVEKNEKIMRLLVRLDHSSRIAELVRILIEIRPDLCKGNSEGPATSLPLPQVSLRGEGPMDSQTLELITVVGSWLAPFIASGFKSFAEKVGGGLGQSFTEQVWKLLKRIPDAADVPERAELEENPAVHHEQIGELLRKEAEKHPTEAKVASDRFWPGLKQLLRNPDFFTGNQMKYELIPGTGYSLDDFGGEAAPFAKIVNNFVDRIRADWRLPDLIEEIQRVKPQLFQ